MSDALKPRVRVPAGAHRLTNDSFTNFEASFGIGTDNVTSGSGYGFNPLSRNRAQLENMYRGSWLVGVAVDAVAEDMTRAGIEIASVMEPDDIDAMHAAMARLCIWQRLCDTIKWARLYGGAIAVMLIDGQKPETPLRLETVGKDQFKGLLVLDRWLIQPAFMDVVTDFGPDLGAPKFYEVIATAPGLPRVKVHYSRVIRFDGIELPFWQKQAENGWGLSIVERLYDRLVAFDSTSQGIAQLVYKAHLRTYKVAGLREIIAMGGNDPNFGPYQALLKQIAFIRRYQANEGITLMDGEDEFEAHSFGFGGLAETLLQFGQQLAGALQIPLVRLFGQSPAGLNATGESDLRIYGEGIHRQQEMKLRRGMGTLLDVLCRSELGKEPPKGFNFSFAPLAELDGTAKAQMAKAVGDNVVQAYESGIIGRATALAELRESSRETGVWSNITEDMIAEADDDPPSITELNSPPAGLADPGDDMDERKPSSSSPPPKSATTSRPASPTEKATPAAETGGSAVSLRPSAGRAFEGKQSETQTKLSKLETGDTGEKVVMAWLRRSRYSGRPAA